MSALHKYSHFVCIQFFYTSSYCLVNKKLILLLLHYIITCAWWRSGSMCVRNVGKILSIRRSRDKVSPISRRTFDSRLKWTPPTYNSTSKIKSQYTQRFNSKKNFNCFFFFKKELCASLIYLSQCADNCCFCFPWPLIPMLASYTGSGRLSTCLSHSYGLYVSACLKLLG